MPQPARRHALSSMCGAVHRLVNMHGLAGPDRCCAWHSSPCRFQMRQRRRSTSSTIAGLCLQPAGIVGRQSARRPAPRAGSALQMYCGTQSARKKVAPLDTSITRDRPKSGTTVGERESLRLIVGPANGAKKALLDQHPRSSLSALATATETPADLHSQFRHCRRETSM